MSSQSGLPSSATPLLSAVVKDCKLQMPALKPGVGLPNKVQKRNKLREVLRWGLACGVVHLSAKLHVTRGQHMLQNHPVNRPQLLTSVF